ncbi:MAG: methyltransferase [Cyclobacteriaceae bacterium]|jgi:tRNA1Val (adenine37-N6)-methyltransferase|nr:methyltransferase [Cyclobacteriaceae bacterium]
MFRFKQFTIEDKDCAHKVGTDGTLLGAWTNIHQKKKILDVGTGSGLIALMLAQRTTDDVNIKAIDIAENDVNQARENFLQSPWFNKLEVIHQSLQKYEGIVDGFDLIVSNPPYFQNSFKPPKEERVAPRHTTLLSFEDLLIHAYRLSTTKGRLSLILPEVEGKMFCELAEKKGWYLTRLTVFKSRITKPAERLLLEFEKTNIKEVDKKELILYEKNEVWSLDYQMLTKEFYLRNNL